MATNSFFELYKQIQESRYFDRLALNPLAQFSSGTGALLGAQLLPEKMVETNAFEETQIRYKVRPALDNNRYSPTQLQAGGQLIGSFRVDLGHTDTQAALDAKEYDDLLKLLNRGGDEQAIANVIRWADNMLVRPHVIKNEIQRWQALLLGQVQRKTTDGAMSPIDYYRKPGNVLTVAGGTTGAPAGWHSPTYSILGDMATAVELLEDLGYAATGMYCTPYLARRIKRNNEIKAKDSYGVPPATQQLSTTSVRLTEQGLSKVLLDETLPTLTTYNNGYEGLNGYQRYMNVEAGYDYCLVTGSTTRNWDMATDYAGTAGTDVSGFTDGALELSNVLGYHAIGRNAGHSMSGRSQTTWISDKKPIGMGGESYQTGLPVIQDPQAFVVLRIQRPV